MNYKIISHYQSNDSLRRSFNELAEKTFGLSFETWYKNGFWRDKYIPYSILSENKIIANVSVNLIDCHIKGHLLHYIQLGTVMTDEAFRGQGLSRMLMERILSDYAGCDGIFLYANDSVVNFYPKFGFQKAQEFRFRTKIHTEASPCVQQVPMNSAEDFEAFLKIKQSHLSRSAIRTDTDDLLMFYLTQFMQECVYKVNGRDCYLIAEQDGDTLTLFDILSNEPIEPSEAGHFFGAGIKEVHFAFVPENTAGLEKYLYQEEDTTFFVLGDTLINHLPDILSFPALVHA